jgi:hypothetical protein
VPLSHSISRYRHSHNIIMPQRYNHRKGRKPNNNNNNNSHRNMPQQNVKEAAKEVAKKVEKEVKQETKSPSLASKIARGIGTFGGNLLGGPAIGKLAGDAGAWLAKITGFGDYKVEGNTLMKEQIPVFTTSVDGTVFTHRECIGDVYGSTVFTNNGGRSGPNIPWSGLINPGNSFLFPWLSTIAQSYESYEFEGLIFEYKSTSSDALNSTNTALGTVIMSTSYNVLAPNFLNKIQAEAYEFTSSAKPSCSFIHPIECKKSRNILDKYYVSGVENIDVLDGDPRLNYMGNFQLMMVGMQASALIGELWVSYKVKLVRPQLPTPLNDNLPYCHLNYLISTAGAATGTIAAGSTLSVTPTGNLLYFPANGRYLINMYGAPVTSTTATTNWAFTGSVSGSYAVPNVMTNQSGATDSIPLDTCTSNNNTTVSISWASLIIDVINFNTFQLTIPTFTASSPNSADMLILPLSSGYMLDNSFSQYIEKVIDRKLRKNVNNNRVFEIEDTCNNNNNSTSSDLTRLPTVIKTRYVDEEDSPLYIETPKKELTIKTVDIPDKRLGMKK